MTGPASNAMSIDKATVDNTYAPASDAMSIDKATVHNASAPASDAMSIDNTSAPASNTTNAMSIDNASAPASNATNSTSIGNICAPAFINATSIEKAIVDKSGAETKTQSKVSDGSQFANLELEAESFLRGITIEVKWQELISKWLAFEKDYPIRGVIFSFL